MKEQFKKLVLQHQNAVTETFTPDQLDILVKITLMLTASLNKGHKLMLCGNGGSAADSQHIAAEFISRYKLERQSIPAIALTTDTSILTATANDYAFDKVFSRQVEGLGQKGDVLIAISTSGNSANIMHAVAAANKKGIQTIGFTGQSGGTLKDAVDVCFHAQTDDTPHIQEIHIIALHAISDIVEKAMAS